MAIDEILSALRAAGGDTTAIEVKAAAGGCRGCATVTETSNCRTSSDRDF
jgi:multimeric flavodoxin WrbA